VKFFLHVITQLKEFCLILHLIILNKSFTPPWLSLVNVSIVDFGLRHDEIRIIFERVKSLSVVHNDKFRILEVLHYFFFGLATVSTGDQVNI
jgi:hypothetical protein